MLEHQDSGSEVSNNFERKASSYNRCKTHRIFKLTDYRLEKIQDVCPRSRLFKRDNYC